MAVEAGMADVVVCHHLAYNVADLATFVSELGRTPVELCSNSRPSIPWRG